MQSQFSINPLESLLLPIFSFIIGTTLGSFLNVVIHRLPHEESVVFPNSQCPRCNAKIRFYDNVPIISWLLLRGRCRNCQTSISYRYPLVELLTGLTFTAFYWLDGPSLRLFVDCLFASALIALIFIDAEHMILPDAITYPGFVFAILARLTLPLIDERLIFDDLNFSPLLTLNQPLWIKSMIGALLGAGVGGGSLWLVGFLWKQLRKVEAMGFGDVKMMLMVGAYSGWRLTILTIFLGALSGAIVGIVLISISSNKDYQTKIPFGIFLGFGTLLALLFGQSIIGWYLATFVSR